MSFDGLQKVIMNEMQVNETPSPFEAWAQNASQIKILGAIKKKRAI